MVAAVMELTLHAPWVHSLKEKRSEVKRLVSRLRHTFNVSVLEAARQDAHQTVVLGIAALTSDAAGADRVFESVLRFVEQTRRPISFQSKRSCGNIKNKKALTRRRANAFSDFVSGLRPEHREDDQYDDAGPAGRCGKKCTLTAAVNRNVRQSQKNIEKKRII